MRGVVPVIGCLIGILAVSRSLSKLFDQPGCFLGDSSRQVVCHDIVVEEVVDQTKMVGLEVGAEEVLPCGSLRLGIPTSTLLDDLEQPDDICRCRQYRLAGDIVNAVRFLEFGGNLVDCLAGIGFRDDMVEGHSDVGRLEEMERSEQTGGAAIAGATGRGEC